MNVRNALVICIVMLFVSTAFAQQKLFKNLELSSALGVGQNYGMMGVKTLVGKKNTGFFLGVGSLGNQLAYQLGGQISRRSVYFSAAYGMYGAHRESDRITIAKGFTLMLGLMKSFSTDKKWYMDIGLGTAFGDVYVFDSGLESDWTNLAFSMGIGYHWFKKKAKVNTGRFQ